MNKIKNFTDLIAWQKGHVLVLTLYKITHSFPKEEIYSLTSQIRRAAVSVTSNIAEGFSRKTKKEKVQFYYISLGSLTELHNQFFIARDLKYITLNEFIDVENKIIELLKIINSLVRSILS